MAENKNILNALAERIGGGKTALELALDNYQMWYDANQALSLNKEYEISNGQNSKRKLSRADADEVQKNLNYWENEWNRLQGSSINAPKINTIYTTGLNHELFR